MTILFASLALTFVLIIALAVGLYLDEQKHQHPHIATDSPCPACGNRGCRLRYDPTRKIIDRQCVTCGCTVQQPPVAPGLFEKKT